MAPMTIDRAIENAVVSTNMEGFALGEEQKQLIKSIISGEITLEDALALFEMLYDWAGEIRKIAIYKSATAFAKPENLAESGKKIFAFVSYHEFPPFRASAFFCD